ncbi:MAG: LmeA family phospholipid-binding protein [Xenococcaceae cyanobacterium]
MDLNFLPDLGLDTLSQQALSEVAKIGLTSQLDRVDNLDVEINTDPLKLAQGELDFVVIKGEGLVVQKHLRTHQLDLKTDTILLDPLKALVGDIELRQPTSAIALIVLTQEDIQTAFNGDFIQNKLRNLSVKLPDNSVKVNIQNVRFALPDDRHINLSADVFFIESKQTKPIAISFIPSVDRDGYSVSLEEVQNLSEEESAPELVAALLDSARYLLDLRNFEINGMSLRLQKLELQPGKIKLQGEAVVDRFLFA